MGMRLCMWRVSELDVARMRKDPSAVEALFEREDALDIDKMWHGLHWLLTGTEYDADGLGEVVFGGSPIASGDDSAPLRVHPPNAVGRLLKALNETPEEALRARWLPDEMLSRGIYPSVWDEGDEVLEEELLPAFRDVRELFATAAQHGQAVALCLG